MKFLFASDSFKGTLSSEQTVELLAKAAKNVFGEIEYSGVPVADGGEGTTDAVIAAENGEKVYLDVFGPLMERTRAYYGKFGENKAVLEMAAASGLPMVPMARSGFHGHLHRNRRKRHQRRRHGLRESARRPLPRQG